MTTPPAPPVGAYSRTRTGAGLVFVSGQGPIDAEARVVGTTIEDQTRQALANVEAALAERGATWHDVLKVGVYLRHIEDFPRYDAAYEAYLRAAVGPQGELPARTTVGADLHMGILVEIDAIALAG